MKHLRYSQPTVMVYPDLGRRENKHAVLIIGDDGHVQVTDCTDLGLGSLWRWMAFA